MFKALNQRISIILLIIAVAYLVMAYQLPAYPYTPVDADVVPKGLGYLLVFLSICLFFAKDSETEEQRSRRNIPLKDIGTLIAVFLFILLYITLLEFLGFIITTTLFIYFCSWFLGYKKHLTNGVVALIFPIFMYITFTKFLQISLPQGLLPF
ncbi:tripartite tricarboxylate transporter TctB family protein [Virgibacillus sp. AGTR]|uniref:tripartite tricarboxylate transporter TctB family protein n=1 Tax=Virgibacillus sp. AGTR TaxID=2812055 RepID=UPI001962B3E8|nr:tripartite tricarboxylate transporter TctB family protein [Virgibacillus sp. AGTR]MCC2249998.1 tripartite tricarboxylate transporter TctB family protein [Virgibacillus sp. AGTR]QRZ18148.1 tripartite tricarboxylate transporter TctB family protein [Virgibacillus sp. AGTR]